MPRSARAIGDTDPGRGPGWPVVGGLRAIGSGVATEDGAQAVEHTAALVLVLGFAATARLQVDRLGRADERGGDEAPGTPATAAPTNAAIIVVGGVRLTDLPTMAGWIRWFSRFMYSTKATPAIRAVVTPCVEARSTRKAPPRKPPTWGMRSVSMAQIAASGISGIPSTSPSASTYRPIVTATVIEPPK